MRRRGFIKAAVAGLCGIGLAKDSATPGRFGEVARRNTANAGELMKIIDRDGDSVAVVRSYVATWDAILPDGSVEHRTAESVGGVICIEC